MATYDSALVVDTLKDTAITVLQARLAPLAAFTNQFSADPIGPRRNVIVPIATSAGSILQNATNFEQAGGAVDDVSVTVNQETAPFTITNAQLNQGLQLEHQAKIHLHALANKIMDVALAPVTTSNYGAAPVAVAGATDVDVDELKVLWGALKDGDVRNLIVDGSIYAQFLPANLEAFRLASDGRNTGIYGFDGFYYNNRWTGAGANIRGFACSPQAIAVASALPIASPVASDMVAQESISIGDLGLTVQMNMWVSRQSRALWASYDVMFGSAVADTTALKLITIGA
jgi:hypothetical protein